MSEVLSLWRGIIHSSDIRTMAEIASDVAATYGLTLDEFRGPARQRSIAHPRQQAMAEMYATGRFSLPQIGRFLGGRDHSTVSFGIDRYKQRLAERTCGRPHLTQCAADFDGLN